MEKIKIVGYELIGLKLPPITCLTIEQQRKEKIENSIETVIGIIVIMGITFLSCVL